jgi:hypothetical protein
VKASGPRFKPRAVLRGERIVLIALKLKLAVAAGLVAAPVMMQAFAPAPVVDDREFAKLAPAIR